MTTCSEADSGIAWARTEEATRASVMPSPDLWTLSPGQAQAQAQLVTGSEYTAVPEDPSCLSSRRLICLGLDTRSLKGSAEGDKVCRPGSHLTQTGQRADESP